MRLSSSSFAVALFAFAAQATRNAHGHSPIVSFFFHLGLLGLFLVSIVDSSFVPLPIPGVTDIMIVIYAASHANVILLVVIATVGSALGGLFSHAVGQAGGMAFLKRHVKPALLSRITKWMEKHSVLAVAVPAILPPPMPLSPFVLVAGAVRMSRRKFMTAFTASRFLRHVIAAWLGVHYGRQVLRLWARFSDKWGTTILIVLWSVILLFTVIGIWQLYRTSRSVGLRARDNAHESIDGLPSDSAA